VHATIRERLGTMNLFLRLLLLLLTAPWRPRCDAFGPVRKRFLVWPADLDVLGHVNNGVYLSMLDVARVDMMLRSGMLWSLRRHRFYAVVAAQTIRFRRSLRLLQSFEVETKVIGWDEKAFLVQHHFLRAGVLVAEAVVRLRFLKSAGGSVSSQELLALLERPGPSPALPAWIEAWNLENSR
jgi:YbgC/YbaW family acyl-CoA thioester hydrolase